MCEPMVRGPQISKIENFMTHWSWWGVWSSKSIKILRWRDFNALRRSPLILELHGAKHSSYLKISFQTKSWSSGSAAGMSNKDAFLKIWISNDVRSNWGSIDPIHLYVASFSSCHIWNWSTFHRHGPATFWHSCNSIFSKIWKIEIFEFWIEIFEFAHR